MKRPCSFRQNKTLLTSGKKGGSHIPACKRLKLISLKNECRFTSLAPLSQQANLFL